MTFAVFPFIYLFIYCSSTVIQPKSLIMSCLFSSPFQEPTLSFAIGSLVWAEDPEVSWIDGEVVEIHGEKITINCTSGKTASRTFHLMLFH